MVKALAPPTSIFPYVPRKCMHEVLFSDASIIQKSAHIAAPVFRFSLLYFHYFKLTLVCVSFNYLNFV